MIVPHMAFSEALFGILVLAAFAVFAGTLAGVHLYVSLPRRQRTMRATVAIRADTALRKDHAPA